MKNKKSKIVAPALGLILLSTAASISGSVAWFTANRSVVVSASEFAVVKTGGNLNIALGAGVGTSVTTDAGEVHVLGTKSGYKLTDASFDHTNGALNVVTPSTDRSSVLSNVALSTLVNNSDDFATAEGLVNRGGNVYSAFTWTMTFSTSGTKKQGLFLDLSASETYMREKVTYTKEAIALGVVGTGLYTDQDLAAGHAATLSEVEGHETELNPSTYGTNAKYDFYRAAPDHTGKAFRIAFIPTAVSDSSNGSVAYGKIWADNETNLTDEGKFIDGVAEDALLGDGTDYDDETIKYYYNASAYQHGSVDAGSGKVLMYNGSNSGVPGDAEHADSYYLANNDNYLGFFNANNGETVSITYTCVAWYEGTHPEIVNSATDFENIVASMKFSICELLDVEP